MSFHKSQLFTLHGRIPKLADRHTKVTGHSLLYPVGGRITRPSWIEYDMKVLCFDGYFHENIVDMQQSGSYRIRRVKIAFYLEDETVQVVEPRVSNSGLPQGNIVKRQRVTERTSHPENKKFITLLDLNVGKTVKIFDRTYYITNCDAATRTFLSRLGIIVPQPTLVPSDPAEEMRRRAELETREKKRKSSTKNTKFAQFLQNYQKVLQFHGYWDDRAAAFGDLRQLVVHYYLADDTIEIKESYPFNSGRHESSGIFLKRMRLPKHGNVPYIGQSTAFSVLNVMGDSFNTGRFIPDPLGTTPTSSSSSEKSEYYSYMDLAIGSEINVFGRKVMLTSCDDFTKKFYTDNFGVEEFPDVPLPAPSTQGNPVDCLLLPGGSDNKLHRKFETQLPPFNGWGTHEDSEGNCKTVEPRPLPIDYDKFVRLDGKMLRFTAKMVTKSMENLARTFIITYYLSNDTIAVYEIPRRNSGFAGGQFLHSHKFHLPNQDLLSAARPKLYTPQHFYIGAKVNLNSHHFSIVGGDEFTLQYMERNRKQFPFSDINVIVEKCRNQFADKVHYKNLMAKYWTSSKRNGGGAEEGEKGDENDRVDEFISTDKVRQLLNELFPNGGISEQEILTVCRHFSVAHQQRLSERNNLGTKRSAVRRIIHAELERNLWADLQALGHYLKYICSYGETSDNSHGLRDFVSPSKILTVIRGTRLPLNSGQVELMLHVLEKNEAGEIRAEDFLNFLEYDNRSSKSIVAENFSEQLMISEETADRSSTDEAHRESFIDWATFVDSLAVD